VVQAEAPFPFLVNEHEIGARDFENYIFKVGFFLISEKRLARGRPMLLVF